MQRLVVKGALQSARFIVPRHLKFTRHHKAFSVQKPALFSRLFATFNGNADKIAQSESILQKAAEQLESGDAEGALKEYQESLDLHPSSAAHYNIGNIYFQLGITPLIDNSFIRVLQGKWTRHVIVG